MLAPRAVPVIENARVLEKGAIADHRQEHLLRHEEIIASVDLRGTRLARRVRSRESKSRVALEQLTDERRLAGAGRSRDDPELTVSRCRRGHSRFCTCSRICSICTFSSTATRVNASSWTFDANVLASRFSS